MLARQFFDALWPVQMAPLRTQYGNGITFNTDRLAQFCRALIQRLRFVFELVDDVGECDHAPDKKQIENTHNYDPTTQY